MSIASRTPEGSPGRCSLCGKKTQLEFSQPGDDAPCPHCGCLIFRSEQLFFRLQQHFAVTLGVAPEKITAQTRLRDLAGDESLALVELVMQLEEELEVGNPSNAPAFLEYAANLTLADLVRFLLQRS